jgi:hypothetical protein
VDYSFRVARTPLGGATNGGGGERSKPPEKPERRVNVQDSINKHKNWFSAFEKNRTGGPENVDSPREPPQPAVKKIKLIQIYVVLH